MLAPLLLSILLSTLLQFVLWRYATRIQNAGWVDFGWSAGMVMAAVVMLWSSDFSWRALLVSLLLFLWAGRLASHLLLDRLWGNAKEDTRYQNLRRHWGETADRNFLGLFLGQALLVGLFMVPALVVSRRAGASPDVWDVLGLGVACLAIAGESLADRQLARFRKDPSMKGQVCRRGMWRYSRHPNYFCEWVQWFGYVLMAVGSPLWILTLLGPIFMYVFLRFVTGIPHTERQSLKSRGDAYRDYQQTTPVFFPWIPHNS
ncbi:DUF1295 domain-containing protein [Kiritimatiellota bacterium B12222]|nr:DUF1295 domain-containing protein [Kiritimatiellota bacterium B12222]